MSLSIEEFPVKDTKLEELKNSCPTRSAAFWNCMNETLDSVDNIGIWPGRECCDLIQSEECLKSCITSSSLSHIQSTCKYGDEKDFFNCLHYQQMEDNCCQNAQNIACYNSCEKFFNDSENKNYIDDVIDNCSEFSVSVIKCVNNFTTDVDTFNPYKYLHCCENTINADCAETCRKSLITSMSEQDIINNVENYDCGQTSLNERCSLYDDKAEAVMVVKEVNITKVGIIDVDSAKLHCCSKAVSLVCQKLCTKIFSNEWFEASSNFNLECLSYSAEEALNYCLDEVEEPCELGCDGLEYCTNFNGRSTEFFRSCSAEADNAARDDIDIWQSQGYLTIFGYQLPVRNISTCSPFVWKSMACILKIKPCHRFTHATSLCREDCYKLLSHCLDWSRIRDSLTISMICARFAFHNPSSPCISIQNYMEPEENALTFANQRVSTPCRNNPCRNPHEICLVNRNCQHGRGRMCQPYFCSSGCRLGVVSRYVVPDGTFVNLPVATSQKGCYKICQCTMHKIEKCQYMPCISLDSCWIRGQKIDHGVRFHIDCNICSCNAGEVICTKEPCELVQNNGQEIRFAYPCSCVPHYVPVCGRNGKTYSNACLAKCAGLTDNDFSFGPCINKDVCDESMCDENEICVPDRKVCLSLLYRSCAQYQCVNVQRSCKRLPNEPVCDTDGRGHDNICYMYKYHKTLAYKGPCMTNCNRSGVVCGIDSNTYTSECHAHANLVNVDYKGPCVTIGISGDYNHQRCSQVVCPPLGRFNCRHIITPPGACCPLCAGALQILFSQKQVDRLLYALHESVANSLTVTAVLKALERQIQTAECSVRGYLTTELQLFVLVIPSIPNPSQLQFDSCAHEAEKLATMVKKSSPRITSELSLSIITIAIVSHDMYPSPVSIYSPNNMSVKLDQSLILNILLMFLLFRIIV